jgi:hypothetical protein
MYNPFKQFIDYLRYRKAVQMADESHAKDGDRYYVMPMAAPAGSPKLIIMDRKNFKRLKFKGYISKNARVRDLVSECFYCTPYANGDGYLNAEGRKKKLALYFSYCQSTRALRKQKKHGKSKS